MEKYGFVYLWFDRKHKRFYIGSHWGHLEDGYVCSSPWMKRAYAKRPNDFKRRILKFVHTSRHDLLAEESLFLARIKPHEIKTKYYNLDSWNKGHWSTDPETRKSASEKMSASRRCKKLSEEHRETLSKVRKGKKKTEQHRTNMSKSQKGRPKTPEQREKIRLGMLEYNRQKKQ